MTNAHVFIKSLQVQYLDEYFDRGAAYALGRMNGNCWYLYTMETGGVNDPDQTLEISFLLI